MIPTLRMKNDGPQRKRLFVPEAMAHPAKGHISMWQEMIERYSQPGDLVVDPMAGIGTSLVAALMGRNVVCVELEPHFVAPMRASWEKMKQHPMLGHALGHVCIIRGDARHLPLASADSIITSPPYEGMHAPNDEQRTAAASGEPFGRNLPMNGHSYADTRPQQVDAVVSSPAYENTAHKPGNLDAMREKLAELYPGHVGPNTIRNATEYGDGRTNIGNLRGAAYWESQAQVYAECWRILRPGGLMALVLKGFTRDGAYVDLPQQTLDLLLAAGWVEHERWRRELWSLSFWRILQKRRDPAAFDNLLNYEEVIAVRKPGAEGGA